MRDGQQGSANGREDSITFHSGDSDAADRPVLVLRYYTP
jgi:hypothetical protein